MDAVRKFSESVESSKAIEKINKIDAKFNTILSLKRQANNLIQDHLPQVWADGDVQIIEPGLYTRILSLLTEASSLELGPDYDRVRAYGSPITELNYIGQFGTIKIKPTPYVD